MLVRLLNNKCFFLCVTTVGHSIPCDIVLSVLCVKSSNRPSLLTGHQPQCQRLLIWSWQCIPFSASFALFLCLYKASQHITVSPIERRPQGAPQSWESGALQYIHTRTEAWLKVTWQQLRSGCVHMLICEKRQCWETQIWFSFISHSLPPSLSLPSSSSFLISLSPPPP